MANKSNSSISIANILAMIGLAGIGVITFFGMLLHSSDGKPGGAILGAVALVAVLAFFLFMSIKAKSADDNPDKWRWVEWGSLALYVIVAFLFATSFLRFFYIVTQKSEMQAQALSEVAAIKDMRSSYEHQYKKFLTNAEEQFVNYIGSGQQNTVSSGALAEYMKRVGTNVSSWAEKAEAVVKLPDDPRLSDIEGKINGWNLMQLASLAADLESLDIDAWIDVQSLIASYKEEQQLIPVIEGGNSQPYSLSGYAEFDLGESPDPLFAQMLRDADGSTVTGWIIYVLLNLLVLLNYVVASRSSFVGPRKRNQPTGGLDL